MRIIRKIASDCRVRLTKIGSIQSYDEKSFIIDDKNKQITPKNKGYLHKF
jgi:thiamine-monophosphate kinase